MNNDNKDNSSFENNEISSINKNFEKSKIEAFFNNEIEVEELNRDASKSSSESLNNKIKKRES